MVACKHCGQKTSFLALFSGRICESCLNNIEKENMKKMLKEEMQKQIESELNFFGISRRYVKPSQEHAHYFKKSDMRKVYGSYILEIDTQTYEKLLKKAQSTPEKVEKIVDDFYKNLAEEIEKKKIKARLARHQIQEKAEVNVFGKKKTKRQLMSSELRERVFNKYNGECAVCGAEQGLHIHHKDKDPDNNRISNLILLCGVCHKKIHMTVR